MNQQLIKALAQEVFFDNNSSKPSDQMYTFSDIKMQKFAELIVRVCANVIPETSGDLLGTYRDQIYEHFGIINESSNYDSL
jgi:hypothetical protein